MHRLFRCILIACLTSSYIYVSGQLDTCKLYRTVFPGYECNPPFGTQEPPEYPLQLLGGGGCNFVNNSQFDFSPPGWYYAEAPNDFCGNSQLNSWMPITLNNNNYQWNPCGNPLFCPLSPSPDIFSNQGGLIALDAYDSNDCFSFNPTSNFLNLISCEGIIAGTNVGSPGFKEVVGQVLNTALTQGTGYVLKYQTAFWTWNLNPGQPQVMLDMVLDNTPNICTNANALTGDINIPAGAQVLTNVYNTGPLQWGQVVTPFISNDNYTNLYIRPNNSAYLPLATDAFAQIWNMVDGVTIIPMAMDPITVTANLLSNGMQTDNYCANECFTVNFNVSLDFVGTNANPIVLQLNYPTFNVFNYLGGNFNANGQVTIPAGGLTQNGLVLTATYTFNPANPNIQIGNGFPISLVALPNQGCLTFPPVVCPTFNGNENLTVAITGPPCDLADIDLTVNCSNGPHTYSWVDSTNTVIATTEDLFDQFAGTYTVTVTSSSGPLPTDQCNVNFNIVVPIIPPPTLPMQIANFVFENPTCPPGFNNGDFSISVINGQGPYSAQLNGPVSGSILNNNSGNFFFSNLTPGVYQVVVTDANGCILQQGFQLQQPFTFSLNVVNASCPQICDGSITFVPDPGPISNFNVTYTCVDLQGNPIGAPINNATINNLCQGVCLVQIDLIVNIPGIPQYSCSWNEAVFIGANSEVCCEEIPLELVTTISNESCPFSNDGSILAEPNGGLGPYDLTITYPDNSQVTYTSIFQIMEANLEPGNYSFVVTDSQDCSDSFLVTVLPAVCPAVVLVDAGILPETFPLSNDGAIDVSLSGGCGPFAFEWYCDLGGSPIGTGEDLTCISAGSCYSLTVQDLSYGCSYTFGPFTIPLLANPILVQNINSETCQTLCDGSIEIQIDILGQLPNPTFTWFECANPGVSIGNDLLISNLCAGCYGFELEYASTCNNLQQSILITDINVAVEGTNCCPEELTIEGVAYGPSCECQNDGLIEINISGGTPPYTTSWLAGQTDCSVFMGSSLEDLYDLDSGTYEVLVTDAFGCTSSATYTISTDQASDFISGVDFVVPASDYWDLNDFPDGTVQHNANIIIPPGVTLETHDLHFRLTQGRRIIIQASPNNNPTPGGELKAFSCWFTPSCGPIWGGFQVYGNPQENTVLSNRGKLALNWCGVHNAEIGIQNFSTLQTVGGYIDCYKSAFYNCRQDLNLRNFMPTADWTDNYGARFRQCSFSIDDDAYNTGTNARISLTSMGDVRFYNCSLTNQFEDMLDDQELTGIRSFSSAFYWDECDPNEPQQCGSSIIGFTRGITITNDLNNNTQQIPPAVTQIGPKIYHTNFQCFRGITVLNAEDLEIAYNSFTDLPFGYDLPVFGFFNPGIQNSTYAISVDGGSPAINGFTIAQNEIEFNADDDRIGIICTGTGPYANLVYRNAISSCECGLYFRNSNRSTNGSVGLRYECNIFHDNLHDIWIDESILNTTNSGVASPQYQTIPTADQLSSAGNSFIDSWAGALCSLTASFDGNSYLDCCDDIDKDLIALHQYRYFGSDLNTSNGTNELGLSCGIQAVQVGPNPCNIDFTYEIAPGEEEIRRLSATNSYYSTKSDWNSLVDGGDTQSLTAEIINTTYAEALNTYYTLVEKSPNLSDEVMIAAIEKEYDLPPVLLTQILSLNPSAAKSVDVQKALDDRMMPLEEYERLQIMAGLEWVSQKEELEIEMNGYLMQRAISTNAIMHNMISSGLENGYNDLYPMLQEDEFLSERLQKASLLRQNGDYLGALTLLSTSAEEFELNDIETAEINAWVQVWQLQDDLAIIENPVLSESQIQELLDIAFGVTNIPGAIAMDILVQYEGYAYEPNLEQIGAEFRSFSTGADIPNEVKCTLMPNPAIDFAIGKLKIPCAYPLLVNLVDLSGRTIKKQRLDLGQSEFIILLDELECGMYFVQLMKEDGLIFTTLPLQKL